MTNLPTSTLPQWEFYPLPQTQTNEIIIRRLCGEFTLPASAMIKPEVIGRAGKLFKWRGTMILDDQRVEFEAESFYDKRIPCVWQEVGLDYVDFDKLFEENIERLFAGCLSTATQESI